MRRGFEWFVAWRHLRDPERRSRRTLIVGIALLAIGGLCLAVEPVLAKVRPRGLFFLRESVLFENLSVIGSSALAVGLLAAILGVLFASFTVFTAISIFGVMLGTGAPIIALSVMSGFEMDLKSKIRATQADVVIGRADDAPFTDWGAIQERIAKIPGVVESMAYVESEVIVKHVSNPAGMGIILRGVDARRAPRVLDLGRTLKEGKVEYLLDPARIPSDGAYHLGPGEAEVGALRSDSAAPEVAPRVPSAEASAGAVPGGAPGRDRDGSEARSRGGTADRGADRASEGSPPGILLGEELFAHTLRVFVGSDVDVACPLCGVGPTGPMPKLRTFRVAGHFYTGMYEFDSKLAYVALEDAQKFLGMRDEVTGIEIRTTNADAAGETASRVAAVLGDDYEVRSWEEMNRGLFMALRLEKLAMFVVLTFIALVASFSIVSNLIMLVTEKGREVAILKSMGATDGAILRVFLAEGLYIGLLGLGIGLVLGVGTCLLISRVGLPLDPDVYYIQKLPVVMRAGEIASVAVAALGLCCLATLYPAYLASRMRPVEGLRYE